VRAPTRARWCVCARAGMPVCACALTGHRVLTVVLTGYSQQYAQGSHGYSPGTHQVLTRYSQRYSWGDHGVLTAVLTAVTEVLKANTKVH
jgi:hypothetical protein